MQSIIAVALYPQCVCCPDHLLARMSNLSIIQKRKYTTAQLYNYYIVVFIFKLLHRNFYSEIIYDLRYAYPSWQMSKSCKLYRCRVSQRPTLEYCCRHVYHSSTQTKCIVLLYGAECLYMKLIYFTLLYMLSSRRIPSCVVLFVLL